MRRRVGADRLEVGVARLGQVVEVALLHLDAGEDGMAVGVDEAREQRPPARSIRRVRGPASSRIDRSSPTARIRPPPDRDRLGRREGRVHRHDGTTEEDEIGRSRDRSAVEARG